MVRRRPRGRLRRAAPSRGLTPPPGGAGFKAGASDPRGINHAGHGDQLADFLRAIDEGRAPLVDGREGRRSVEVIRAIYESARTGAAVRLPYDDPAAPR